MSLTKTFGLAATIVAASIAFIGTSSAMADGPTALCEVDEMICPVEAVYPAETKVLAELQPETESLLLGPNLEVVVRCKESHLMGRTTAGLALAEPLEVQLEAYTFAGCVYKDEAPMKCTVTLNQIGGLLFLRTAVNLAEATADKFLFTYNCGNFFKCTYTLGSLVLHALGTGLDGSPAELTAYHQLFIEETHTIGCLEELLWDAKYHFLEPKPMYIST